MFTKSERLKGGKDACARPSMVNDWGQVILTNAAVRANLLGGGHGPRLVEGSKGRQGQLGQPGADIVALRINLSPLGDEVEKPLPCG
jgi:hypothetical protein